MSQEDPRKITAQNALLAGDTIASIAASLGVNRRTIERWADEGNWREQKQAEKVISFERPAARQDEPVKVRQKRRCGQIDELEIVESAIVSLDLLIAGMSGMSDEGRSVDTRGIGSTAGALVKLLEYRRKIQPPTAAELADLVLELNISPQEFVAELKQRWLQRA